MKIIARIVLPLAIIVAAVGLHYYFNYGPGYYKELNRVRAELAKIPDIEVKQLTWRDEEDFPLVRNLENISVTIEVKGKGEIQFAYISEDSFREPAYLGLVSIGPHQIRSRGRKYSEFFVMKTGKREVRLSEYLGGTFNLSAKGKFAHLFPNAIPNIQTAIEEYDSIFHLVDNWAESSTAHGFKNTKGEETFFWVVEGNWDSRSDPIWSLSFAELQSRAIY